MDPHWTRACRSGRGELSVLVEGDPRHEWILLGIHETREAADPDACRML